MTPRTENRRERNRNRAWITVATLLAATLLIGAATHGRALLPGAPPVLHAGGGGAVSFSGNLDRGAVLLGGDGLVRIELRIEAEDRLPGVAAALPTDLVVVLDRSGSMRGEKIRDARAAVRQLISQLGPEDRFALVAFSSTAELAIPLGHATSAASRWWSARVEGIAAAGGTRMSPALDLALGTVDAAREVNRIPRIILISDGLAAEPHPVLRSQAARAAAGEYTLSAVGVGADFDEDLMAQLADAGTGNYYYLEDAASLARIFLDEFETARQTVASGLVVTLRPGAGIDVVEASGYPLEQKAGTTTFRPGTLFAGQERRVWVTFRVPTGTEGERALGSIALTYTRLGETERISLPDLPAIACVPDERDFFANLDVDRWAKSVVVEEYGALQHSVAGHVKSGRFSDARAALELFSTRNRGLNRLAASPAVAAQLDAVAALEEAVDDAFSGSDQQRKQKLLGKALHAESYEKRRAGSRR